MNSMYKMALIAAMAMGGYEWYGSPRVNKNTRRFELSDKQKECVHKDYANQFHKYTIDGVEIIAKSKNDARRIYKSKKV